MSADSSGVYLPTSDPTVYESTEFANAGWYDEGQHGGALAALIGGHMEMVETIVPMQATRFTLELFRVVPLVPLTLKTRIVRQGKRIQVTAVSVFGAGVEVAQALVQRLRIEEIGLPDGATEEPNRLPGPEGLPLIDVDSWGHGPEGKVMFHRNCIEVREIEGGFHLPGPGSIWMRLDMPIIADQENSALQKALVIADFCNGVSRPSLAPDWVFMNPDLTVNLNRLPVGDWVALKAESAYAATGRGIATGTLWDLHRFLGRSTQTLYVDRINGRLSD
jgi:hypothetical protein